MLKFYTLSQVAAKLNALLHTGYHFEQIRLCLGKQFSFHNGVKLFSENGMLAIEHVHQIFTLYLLFQKIFSGFEFQSYYKQKLMLFLTMSFEIDRPLFYCKINKSFTKYRYLKIEGVSICKCIVIQYSLLLYITGFFFFTFKYC